MSTTAPPPGSGGPEYLDPSDGEPVRPGGSGVGGRRTALVAGGAVLGLALVGGGVWAAMSFFSTGAQPAEALPSSTIGYASVDLDPSGGQKIEAFRMIEKFPELEKELGGLDADDDLLEKLFEGVEESCEGVSYADDVKPWLGYRFAVAAVDVGEENPTPVGVLQVKDANAAEDGLAKLAECGGGEAGGWEIDGEWAVVAETDDIARQVVDATADGTLAEDETFQEWTEEVGDAGVVNMYAAPEAGRHLAELARTLGGPFGPMGALPGAMDPMDMSSDDPPASPALPEEMSKALEEFQGMAATLRFDDGALEFEVAGAFDGEQLAAFEGASADDTVSTLPEDTAVAFGIGLPDGWLTTALEQAAEFSGGEMTVDDMAAELEAQSGLTIEEIETLAGDSVALSLGGDFDPETMFNSSDGSDVPIGAKIRGDTGAIQDVLGKIAGESGADAAVFGNDADGDFVAVGPNGDYRAALLEDGGLGDSEVFRNVVREADEAGAILFVNFDAGDWLTKLAEGDQTAEDNLAPLQGIGFSSWVEDDASHAVFRLTTN